MWPRIGDKKSAKSVSRWGFYAALICFSITLLGVILANFNPALGYNLPYTALVDASIFGGVAVGTWRLSRTWAVVGLVLYLIEIPWAISHMGFNPMRIATTLLLVYAFANGVRGAFYYHRLVAVDVQNDAQQSD